MVVSARHCTAPLPVVQADDLAPVAGRLLDWAALAASVRSQPRRWPYHATAQVVEQAGIAVARGDGLGRIGETPRLRISVYWVIRR